MVGCRKDGGGMRLAHPQVTARAEEKVQRFSCFCTPNPPSLPPAPCCQGGASNGGEHLWHPAWMQIPHR